LTLKTIPFQELPFSNLFCDYCKNYDKLSEFFEFNPFENNSIRKKVSLTAFKCTPELETVLSGYNDSGLMHPKAIENLNALASGDEVFTVVTGQQLTIAGGPMFTVYKILTAIEYARRIESSTGKKVVPVFWLADEDHDYDEIAKIGMPHGSDWQLLELLPPYQPGMRVAEIKLNADLSEFERLLDESLIQNDFKSEVQQLFSQSYRINDDHGLAFRSLITRLFSKYGLLIAGSAQSGSRKFLKEAIISLIQKTDTIHTSLEETSQQVEKLYHRQASVSASNWFYIKEDGIRQKMHFENGVWSTSDFSITTDELIDRINQNPAVVSPNVFMRPLLQDFLLPNLAYVAGPGEVSYYAQMKGIYAVSGLHMPIIVPRFSATILEGSVKKNFEELPFRLVDYSERLEDLEARFMRESDMLDVSAFIQAYNEDLEQIAESRIELIQAFDRSLTGTLQKVKSDQQNALENLRSKMMKSVKNSLDVQLKRINKVQFATFPNRNLQERELAFIYLLNKYGIDVLDRIFESVAQSDFREHHIETL
jgi:bacillithiol synthase